SSLVVHRLVKTLPVGRWITKGDSLLRPDPCPAEPAAMEGRVEAIVRGRRLIRLSSGPRSSLGRLYSILSLHNFTPGALRVRVINALTARLPQGDPSLLDPERRFLIAVLDGRSPATMKAVRDIDWDRFLEIACREGVPGIVYGRIRGSEIPPGVLSTFKHLYEGIAARNLLNLKVLERLEQALQGEHMEIMTLKGASLIGRVYPGMGMRPMSDIDLMVRAGDQARLEELLAGLGYRRDPLIGHLFERDNIIIDLHVHALNTDRIANRAALFPSGMEPIWANSVPWKDGGRQLKRPDDVDNVLLLSQHLMKHSFSGLIWLVDIHELLKDRDSAFWARLSRRAEYLMQRRVLSYPLYLLNRLFGFEPPRGTVCGSQTTPLSSLERTLMDARAGGHPMDRMGAFLALLCIRGPARRIAFLWETLFPSRKVAREEFRTSFTAGRTLFCGFRLLEAARVISRQLSTIVELLIKGLR
ncbi:MAG: nucleotidyltransferase family protein, partial [Syntrophales bacterium LBB04]|nr:nucleotidyltransferase family protein [Syntrophales bacterium LBB04]